MFYLREDPLDESAGVVDLLYLRKISKFAGGGLLHTTDHRIFLLMI